MSKRSVGVALIAALLGAVGGTAATLYVADVDGEKGASGIAGEEGERGARGARGLRGFPGRAGQAATVDPEEVWQVIEGDTSRLSAALESGEPPEPVAEAICDELYFNGADLLRDVWRSAC